MLTMEEIDRIQWDKNKHGYMTADEFNELCAAARRGVELEPAPCCQEWHTCKKPCSPLAENWRMDAQRERERAEKAEAELAAIKVDGDEAARRDREEIAQLVERWAVIHDGADFDCDALVDEIRAQGEHDEQH